MKTELLGDKFIYSPVDKRQKVNNSPRPEVPPRGGFLEIAVLQGMAFMRV
jgi:hypothetical protein